MWQQLFAKLPLRTGKLTLVIGTLAVTLLFWGFWARPDNLYPISSTCTNPETTDFEKAVYKFALDNGFVDAYLASSSQDLRSTSRQNLPIVSPPATERPLILFAYFETPMARRNYEFFIKHGLHGAADFVFIFNGETDAASLLPNITNIRVIHRKNECYDLGAFAEVLLDGHLYKKYNKFITMNASLRGPFLPVWADGVCWSDVYLNMITDQIKLVGLTMNCDFQEHIQSMLWAYDRTTLDILLFPTETQVEGLKALLAKRPREDNCPVPPMTAPGINSCPVGYWDAVAIEVYATALIRAAGYKAAAVMSAYWSRVGLGEKDANGNVMGSTYQPDFETFYEKGCKEDVLLPGTYYGMDFHPFETMFMKTNRGIAPDTVQLLTEWADGRNYTSFDYCR